MVSAQAVAFIGGQFNAVLVALIEGRTPWSACSNLPITNQI